MVDEDATRPACDINNSNKDRSSSSNSSSSSYNDTGAVIKAEIKE